MLGVSWKMTCQAVKTSSCSWSVGCVPGLVGLGRARLVDFGAIGLLGGSAGPGHGLYAGCAEGDPGGRWLDAQQFLGGGLHHVGEIKCCVGSRSAQQAQASDRQGVQLRAGKAPRGARPVADQGGQKAVGAEEARTGCNRARGRALQGGRPPRVPTRPRAAEESRPSQRGRRLSREPRPRGP